ncbi:MAG TPA: histidinol dehydrogenase, partial [Deltaproteobacteria bacterium]|nr:histidinol dehydrogenase [Deltaproteobacteria bacterium]
MEVIKTQEKSWQKRLSNLLERTRMIPEEVDETVREIIQKVKDEGDHALFSYTKRFDGFDPAIKGICISAEEISEAYSRVDEDITGALKQAAQRIEAFHLHQKEQSWITADESGIILGQKVTPIERVG